nr:MAG: hypothetical protein [Bacteriophage sp.]
MIKGLDGSTTMDIPVTVNLSSYGATTQADTGDRVTVWTSSSDQIGGFTVFSRIGGFTVPSAGGTVSIYDVHDGHDGKVLKLGGGEITIY